MPWEAEYIRPKLKTVEVTLASGWVTVVSAPLSGALRHVVNAIASPDRSASGIVGFAYGAVRASGASGSETTKKIFPLAAQTPVEWGDDNPEHQVLELKLGEEFVGRTDVLSGDADITSLWWEE